MTWLKLSIFVAVLPLFCGREKFTYYLEADRGEIIAGGIKMIYWLMTLYIFAGVTYLRSLLEIEKLGKELDSIFAMLSENLSPINTGNNNRAGVYILVVLLWPFLSLIATCKRT